MAKETVYDASLLSGITGGSEKSVDFRRFGVKRAGFAALAWALATRRYYPLEALRAAVEDDERRQDRQAQFR